MRVVLKISGEALMGEFPYGIDGNACRKIALTIKELQDHGHEVAIVLGGGNIFRGIQQGSALKLARTPADQIGMLATLMNGAFLEQILKELGCAVKLFSALDCPSVAEKFNWQLVMDALAEKYLLIFVGGIGHPYFTTDTNAALRANEIQADLLIKATRRVDGVYDRDPLFDKSAKKYTHLTYSEMLQKKIGVMDLTAVTLCMNGRIPIRVLNFYQNSLLSALSLEEGVGTLITGE